MTLRRLLALVMVAGFLSGCATPPKTPVYRLEPVVSTTQQWNGIAASSDGRIFLAFPRWSTAVPVSVGELLPDGTVKAFPDATWNAWDGKTENAARFVSVLSVHVDARNTLWVLDAGNPFFGPTLDGAAKLVEIDLGKGIVVRVLPLDGKAALPTSFLNDLVVDAEKQTAYITDCGAPALVVVDLKKGRVRRVLEDHASTKSEKIEVTIAGKPVRMPDGSVPDIHADGLVLDANGDYLYFQALTARTLHRIDTEALRDTSLSKKELADKVDTHFASVVADGLYFARDGYLYITSLEDQGLVRLTPSGELEKVASDPALQWPASLAEDKDGHLLILDAQVQHWGQPPGKYTLYRMFPPLENGDSKASKARKKTFSFSVGAGINSGW